MRVKNKGHSTGRTIALLVIAIVCVVSFVGLTIIHAALSDIYQLKFPGSNIKPQQLDFSKKINMLIIGVDAPYLEDHARSDTMMIISFDPDTKKVYLMSIARDTWVSPPWLGFPTKINAINNPDFCFDCGTQRLIETIEWLTEIKIHCYMKTNFRGFAQIVDVLGGVDINVEKDMDYEDIDGTSIHLKQGFQHLNGQKSLEYVRFRHTDADWQIDLEGKPAGRVARQANFIKAIFKELLQFKNVGKFGQIIQIIKKNIETNLDVQNGLSLLFKLQGLMKETKDTNIVVLTWWGEDGEIETGEKEIPYLSIVKPNLEKIREQCKEYMSDEPPTVKQNP